MSKFRLPRKEKKKLKKQFWLYARDEKGSSRMAFPAKRKEDYDAMKQGLVKSFFDWRTPEEKEKKKLEFKTLSNEVYVPDQELKNFVNKIFAKNYRISSYDILLEAKNHPVARNAYFNFINAYQKHLEDDSFGNICCLAVDRAKEILKSRKRF
jgi:hypothetical protein